jgi:hypothetical protein
MNLAPLVQLASYGPGWALMAVAVAAFASVGGGIILLLKWILGKQYDSFRDDHRAMMTFISVATESMRDIKNACDHCHIDVVSTVKTEMGNASDRIRADMRTEHERTRETTRDVITAIGREEDRTISAVKEVLAAVQRDNDLSRPHNTPPPVLGPGSQVRDSAAPLPPPSRRSAR